MVINQHNPSLIVMVFFFSFLTSTTMIPTMIPRQFPSSSIAGGVIVAAAWTTSSTNPSRLRIPLTPKSTTAARVSPLTVLSSSTTTTANGGNNNNKINTLDGKEIRGPITLLHGTLLVKVKDTLTATSGGILLPDQLKQRSTEGYVIAVGPGKLHPYTGVRITNPISVGMSVVYGKFDGTMMEYNGNDCQLIRDDDVLLSYTGLTMKLDTVEPIRDYVLIDISNDPTTPTASSKDTNTATKSGIVIAAQVMKDNLPCIGRVVKIGTGRMASTGEMTTSPVQINDIVKFREYAGNDIIIEGKLYSVVKMIDLLCTKQQ